MENRMTTKFLKNLKKTVNIMSKQGRLLEDLFIVLLKMILIFLFGTPFEPPLAAIKHTGFNISSHNFI